MVSSIIISLTIISTLIYFLIKIKNEKILFKKELEELKIKYAPVEDLEQEKIKLENLKQEYKEKYGYYKDLKEKIEIYTNEEKFLNCGFYESIYNLKSSNQYSQKLNANKTEQKLFISQDMAVRCNTEFIVQGSKSLGEKMIKKEKELMLKAFNSKCDMELKNIKWNNADLIKKRILKSFEEVNKVGAFHDLAISENYLKLKTDEIQILYEMQQKIYQEKEEQRALREQLREEQKILEEAEKARKQREEEERQRQEIEKIRQEAYNQGQLDKVKECDEKLAEKDKIIEKLQRTESNAQKTKYGHVYVISNVGSFGENVYKIGLTRRDNPKDRVDELGDASVPFKFFINGLIESEDAPALETELHKIFANNTVNKINQRKEFFNVTLDEIQKAVNKITNKDIEFKKCWDLAFYEDEDNQDYLRTLEIIKSCNKENTIIEEQKEDLPIEI